MRREKIVVAFFGLPGAGKGTQAFLAAQQYGLVNFDTGKLLEAIWYDPKRQNEALVKKERAIFEAGTLNTPSFVLNEVIKKTRELAKSGQGIVFSGSPRTMFEAEGELPVFEKLYGKKNVFFFLLDVDPSDSMRRNSRRRLCTVCKNGLLALYYPSKAPKQCPLCAGKLYRRTLDDPKVIPNRLVEYKNRTWPLIAFFRKKGHKVIRLDGRPAPYLVFQQVVSYIEKHLSKN